MKSQLSNSIALLAICLFFFSCEKGPQPLNKILFGSLNTQLNPYEKVPLGAQLTFATQQDCQVEIEVDGKVPVKRTFSTFQRNHEIPVLGLYPDTTNTVKINLTTKNQKEYTGEIQIQTNPLPHFLPTIDIVKLERENMEPGFHLVDMLIANNGKFLCYTIMFDDNGDIRWFMDMSSTGKITYTNYRLKNGNWLYLSFIDLLEVNDLGKLIKKEGMWGHAGDHDLLELPDGRLLMGASKKDAFILRNGQPVNTTYDFAIIWDRKQNRTVKEWDLREVLDVDRSVYPADYSLDFSSDWFHINAIAQSKKDNSLVLSGRNQGVLKVDNDNKLQWILAPHVGWGKSGYDGKGFETADYLLTAIDANGQPLPRAVQEGRAGTEDFEWPTGQHAPIVLDNGNVLLFDNGLMRNLQTKHTYSRAVEYKIDQDKKTIQQVWEYGKKRGLDMYSPITSDVDVLPITGNRLITAGTIRKGSLPPHAKLVEVSYPDGREVFEANIFFKDALGTKEQSWAQFDLVYRGERYHLIEPASN